MKHVIVAVALLAWVSTANAQPPVVHEGIVQAPVDSVWSAFTTSAGLESWMAAHASMDLRVGGSMKSVYAPSAKLGDATTIENTVLSFEPARMLSLKVAKAPAGFPFPHAIQNMWTVVYFDSAAGNSTRIREVSMGFGEDAESQRMREFFTDGNARTLEALQKRFAPASK